MTPRTTRADGWWVRFPEFALKARGRLKDDGLDSEDRLPPTSPRHPTPANGKVVFFWPKDFTFVCPTEIIAFGRLAADFADRDTVVYGVSVDSEFVHLYWRLHHDDLRDLCRFRCSPTIKRELAEACGGARGSELEGVALRATFIRRPGRCDPLRGSERPVWLGGIPPKCCASWMHCRADASVPMQLEQGPSSSPVASSLRESHIVSIEALQKTRLPDYAQGHPAEPRLACGRAEH